MLFHLSGKGGGVMDNQISNEFRIFHVSFFESPLNHVFWVTHNSEPIHLILPNDQCQCRYSGNIETLIFQQF